MGLRRDKITTILWGPPPATHEERKLLVKLDVTILSYICLSYFINYIEYVSLPHAKRGAGVEKRTSKSCAMIATRSGCHTSVSDCR